MTPRSTARISQAHDRLEQERTRTQAEAHAFQQFSSRIAEIEVPMSRVTRGTHRQGPIRRLTGADAPGAQLTQLEDAYRDTILNTAHYETEYDDTSLYDSIAAELTPEIAHSLKHNDQLTPALRTAIRDTATQAYTNRTAFLDILEQEVTSLAAAQEELHTIETAVTELADPPFETWDFTELTTARDRLLALEDDCDTLAQQRQQFLDTRGPTQTLHFTGDIDEYLYQPHDFTHPILSAIATCVDRIQRIRRWIEQVLAQQ
jgi:two-component sensor histidine kinase